MNDFKMPVLCTIVFFLIFLLKYYELFCFFDIITLLNFQEIDYEKPDL